MFLRSKPRQKSKSLSRRREERELLFWTIREALKLAALAALLVYTVIYLAVTLLSGQPAGPDQFMPLLR